MLHTISSNMDNKELAQACREIASHFEGDVAGTLFEYYDVINATFFSNELPQAFILTSLTPYGRCIGLTKQYARQPIILLHPTLKTEDERFYTLLHESIHVQVRYVLGYHGSKSHDSDEWLAECNRIAPLLGYQDVVLGASKVSREKKQEGGKLKRLSTGTVPYDCSYHFPQALASYTRQPLPPASDWVIRYYM